MVVMGAISRSGLKRLVIGNIAEQVLDALPCDVLVMKPANFKSRVKSRMRGVQLVPRRLTSEARLEQQLPVRRRERHCSRSAPC